MKGPEKAKELAPRDWPGYNRDDQLISLYVDRLAGAFGTLNTRRIAEQYAQDNPLDGEAWLETQRVRILGDRAVRVLEDLYVEFAALGMLSAERLIEDRMEAQKAITRRMDWKGWTPGDADAARRLLGDGPKPGLQQLLDRAGVTIKGIRQTRYKDLARILAAGKETGASSRAVAANIRQTFSKSRTWSNMVARTEGRRAVTASTVDTFLAARLDQVEWAVAWGNACPICKGFAALGPVPIGEGFDGLEGPPAHPNCLCVIYPVIPTGGDAVPLSDLPSAEAAEVTPNSPDNG